MDFLRAEYIEIDIIAVLVLVIMLVYCARKGENNITIHSEKTFVKMLLCNMIILITDAITFATSGFTEYFYLNYTACIIYFSLHSYFGYLWLAYSIKRLYPDVEIKGILRHIMMIPNVIFIALVITTPWTNIVFSVSANNVYQRGDYIWLSIVFSYIYWIASAIIVIYAKVKADRVREESVYRFLLIFPIPTLVGIIIQMPFFGLSIVWVCTTLSLLIIFINVQNNQLSRDVLTGLFNRSETNRQIFSEINSLQFATDYLFVIMIDLDRFKNINDTYGHLEGDRALIDAAKILKDSCKKKDFVARYGGDEFIIIGHVSNEDSVNEIVDKINQKTDEFNETMDKVYKLSFSAGCSVHDRKYVPTADSMITEADRNMYFEKNKKKHRTFVSEQ